MIAQIRTVSLLLVLALAPALIPALARPADAGLAEAMDAVRRQDFEAAFEAAGAPASVAHDVVEWHWLRAGRGDAATVLAFLERNGDWPGIPWLREKSEGAFVTASFSDVLSMFDEVEPQTPDGVLAYVNALRAAGRGGEADATLVLGWRTMAMGATQQSAFLAAGGDLLPPHNVARLDRLLWDGHRLSARRMLTSVDDGTRALALARLALQEQAAGVDTLIERVPEDLADDPGLAYDRFEWRARKGRTDDALELMIERSTSAQSLGQPESWAGRRRGYARQLMRAGEHQRAYEVAMRHGLVDGSDFADLEWLSGYLALTFLDQPETALLHFLRLDEAVQSPISKGRAKYWTGRALDALGDTEVAQIAYREGGEYQSSFYGLLAAERAGLPFDPSMANPPELAPWQEAEFTKSTVFRAAVELWEAEEYVLAERFFTHLTESLTPEDAARLGQMALDLDDPHLSVMISKRAAQDGVILAGYYYPLHPVADEDLPMAQEMVLSIARRESEFDPGVISGAGALGFMQVMPATGQLVADDLGIRASHSSSRMLEDWRYNAKLGANYLATLAAQLGGNVSMMAAGYNAGPGRPLRWMEDYGDPRGRNAEIDIVDWIEMIPFNETRNYIMRVTESLPVYRARLGKEPLPIPFSEELRGATLRAYAP
ncbi:MAG: lytic transglycosylase domain-containing protein [Paracoccus sp. (in: a-proteobacteria)]|uniref:Tail length tape measure protein n=1 Tax=Marinibacterium profundimaris TaxID=1679460 RepID=A0A225NSN7_9RHOB|nr:lytic transglycosylase domain-containing protein [Marinibacterium profundimaris]OWU76047.1 tail length tape measure protein [Marinibacterium profundimaris]